MHGVCGGLHATTRHTYQRQAEASEDHGEEDEEEREVDHHAHERDGEDTCMGKSNGQ